jgi:hypothetical protein
MPEHLVNDQIVESVADVVTLNSGHAPAQSAAMLDIVMAETIGMSMYNAVSRQQSSSMVGSAAVTSACAKMLQTPFPILPPLVPYVVPPSGLQPLPVPPGGLTDAEAIAVAGVDAGAAIDVLAAEAQGSDVTSATAVLKSLAKQINAALAALNPPAPAPSPAPSPSPAPMQAKRSRPVKTPAPARARAAK